MNFFKMSLTLQMALATVLGIAAGLFFGELTQVFDPWGSAYIMILKITTIPYLVGAIMHGVGLLTTLQAKDILKKGAIFISIAWAINIVMIYLTAFLFPHGQGAHQASYNPNPPPPVNFADLLIPENIFYALSNNIVPAIVVFSLLVGIALMHLKEKKAMMGMLETLVDSLSRVTSWIARITPIGTFVIIADQVGTIKMDVVKQMGTYIFLYIIAISIVVFWIFPRLISMLTTLSAFKWIKDLLPILLLAYTTNVVIVCLPFIMQLIQRETAQLDPDDEKAQSQIQGTVSVVFNLPLGSLFIALFIFFVASFYQINLTIANQIQLFLTTFLTALGAVGIGSWINNLTFIVDALGLPIDSIDLFLTTIPFTGGFQSMVSAMEIATLSLFITFACRRLIAFKWPKVIRSSLVTAAPIFILFFGLKIFNPFPKPADQNKSIYDLSLRSDVQTIIYTPGQSIPSASVFSNEDTFDRILRTKTLRVGYQADVPPFCFTNHQNQLAGYDVAFAYELAHDLDCNLEFIPLDYGKLIEEINTDLYDIAMSGVSINEPRLRSLLFTTPYSDAKLSLIAKDKYRRHYANLADIQMNYDVKIAVRRGSAYEIVAKHFFPHHEIVALDSNDDFLKVGPEAALICAEPEAITWSLQHPHFAVILTKPILGIDTLAYPLKTKSERFLNFMNQWLKLKSNEGFTANQYDIWVLNKTAPHEAETPRWSVIRDVLHWTK